MPAEAASVGGRYVRGDTGMVSPCPYPLGWSQEQGLAGLSGRPVWCVVELHEHLCTGIKGKAIPG